MYQFNGFTNKANVALNRAIETAMEFGHTYVGSEHLLIGLLLEGTGIAAHVLTEQGVTTAEAEQLLYENSIKCVVKEHIIVAPLYSSNINMPVTIYPD